MNAMSSRRAGNSVLAALLFLGCKTTPRTDPREDAAPALTSIRTFVFDAGPASSAAEPAPDAGPVHDFEDQFRYGQIDAGPGDRAGLVKPAYVSYANPRFQFALDVPATFTPMPEPTNGDGMQWRLGSLVAMTASGMHGLDLPLSCPNSKNVTKHRSGKNTCWATGKKDGFVFWVHIVRKEDVDYSLRFQYAESVKEAMDPIVEHVSASWNP